MNFHRLRLVIAHIHHPKNITNSFHHHLRCFNPILSRGDSSDDIDDDETVEVEHKNFHQNFQHTQSSFTYINDYNNHHHKHKQKIKYFSTTTYTSDNNGNDDENNSLTSTTAATIPTETKVTDNNYSTEEDDQNDHDDHDVQEMKIILQNLQTEIRALASAGEIKKAEKMLSDFQQTHLINNNSNDDDDDNKVMILKDLQTCYNSLLQGLVRTATNLKSAEYAERIIQYLKSSESLIKPNIQSYYIVLQCWSRVKQKNYKYAGVNAERILRIILSEQQQLQSQQEQSNSMDDNDGLPLLSYDPWTAYHYTFRACARSNDGKRSLRILHEVLSKQQQLQLVLSDEKEDESSSTTTTTKQQQLQRQEPPEFNKHMISSVLLALRTEPEEGEKLLERLHNIYNTKNNNNNKSILDAVHYTLVLEGWAKQGNGARAEALFHKMLANKIQPDTVTYTTLLDAWSNNIARMEDLFQAMIYDYLECPIRNSATDKKNDVVNNNEIEKNNSRPSTNNTLAAVKPTVKTLGTLMKAYVQVNDPKRAEAMLSWIVEDARILSILQPNIFCFSIIMDAWTKAREPERAETLLRLIQQAGLEPNIITFTTVIRSWALVGNAKRAQALWDEMIHKYNIEPNLYSYNTLILAYAKAKQPYNAQRVLQQAENDINITPNEISYATVFKAWGEVNEPARANEFFEKIRQKEKKEKTKLLDLTSHNMVLRAYSQAGMPHKVEAMIREMLMGNDESRRPNEMSFTELFLSYARSADSRHQRVAGEKAEEWFKKMLEMEITPNVFSMNALLQCYSISGNPQQAEDTLKSIQQTSPDLVDVVSYNICINAWARVGNAHRAEQLLLEMIPEDQSGNKQSWMLQPDHNRGSDNNQIEPDVQSFSNVLMAWSKQASVQAAEHADAILRQMKTFNKRKCRPDTISYNTVLHAWLLAAARCQDRQVREQCAQRADELFSEMEALSQTSKGGDRVCPDRVSYLTLIRVWSHAQNGDRVKMLKEKSLVVFGSEQTRASRGNRKT